MEKPLIEQHVESLQARGLPVAIVNIAGQNYAHVQRIAAPSPPWDREEYDILVAIPGAYDAANLDGFYLALPYRFREAAHPRVNGAFVEIGERRFQQVSWHYPDSQPWRRGQDDLETHLSHCRGFFSGRGAINDL
jgi:hypothetical protein